MSADVRALPRDMASDEVVRMVTELAPATIPEIQKASGLRRVQLLEILSREEGARVRRLPGYHFDLDQIQWGPVDG